MDDTVDHRAIVSGYVNGAAQRDGSVRLGYGEDFVVVGRNDNFIDPRGLKSLGNGMHNQGFTLHQAHILARHTL